MGLCDRCKKQIADEEIVLTQKQVEDGVTVESVGKKKYSDPNEVVKTQAQVEEEASRKRGPVEDNTPVVDEGIPEEHKVPEEAPKNNVKKVKALMAKKKKSKKKKE